MTTEPKHTPTPDEAVAAVLAYAESEIEARLESDRHYPEEQWEGKRAEEELQMARPLIKAAPELLTAAKALLEDAQDREETTDEDGDEFADYRALRLAIEKAEGR